MGSNMKQAPACGRLGRRKILVLGKDGAFSEDVVMYAIHLAERLDYDLLALSVGQVSSGKDFAKRAARAADMFKREAVQKGIHCDHVVKTGELNSAVVDINHEVKRIEFVVTDLGVNREEVSREVTIPMFSVISDSLELKAGGRKMGQRQNINRPRPVARTIGLGILSGTLYAAVFWNADTVMHSFTKGGFYAALPILTVFAFSFVHGAFTSSVWSALGIEALKKASLRQTEKKVVQKRKQVKKNPRAYAYVNPFHRIDKY
jgi:hypothetical protein